MIGHGNSEPLEGREEGLHSRDCSVHWDSPVLRKTDLEVDGASAITLALLLEFG